MSDVPVIFPEICCTGRTTVLLFESLRSLFEFWSSSEFLVRIYDFPVSITKEFYMSKVSWRAMPLSALLTACFLMAHLRSVSGDEWQPVTQEELKMTSLPEAPGAPAVILYKQVDKDDGPNSHEYTYVRIKVLT